MAVLTAGTGSGAATQADQFAENFVQEYVSDMEAGMDHVWNELNIEVSYKSLTKKECEKEIDLTDDEPADYTYFITKLNIQVMRLIISMSTILILILRNFSLR